MFCGQTMTRNQCRDNILRRQSRALLIAGALSFSHSAWAQLETDTCVASKIQPEAIDLDQPRDQLARQSDLIIPEDARITRINIVRRPIFDTSDPEQDNFLYRSLNALNTPTWKSALRAQLVFDEGDVYQPGTLDESERILRQSEYLTAAWIGVTRVCGNELEVTVLARDTWTLLPSVGASRTGGENKTNAGLSDPNFLGSGKSVGVSHKKRRRPQRDQCRFR